MKIIKILFAFCGAVLLNGCAATLLPVSVTKNPGLSECINDTLNYGINE